MQPLPAAAQGSASNNEIRPDKKKTPAAAAALESSRRENLETEENFGLEFGEGGGGGDSAEVHQKDPELRMGEKIYGTAAE